MFATSHIPLHKWLLALHLMCESKEGLSALRIQRAVWGEDEITEKASGSYRTAWFMCRRIRWAMTQMPTSVPLSEETAVLEFFRLKPTKDMPRPGAQRRKSIVADMDEEFGRIDAGRGRSVGSRRKG